MPNSRTEILGRGTRGYTEIVYSVLSVCLNGALRTHIMFRCNLNSKQLHFYIDSLVSRGLLQETTDSSSPKTTFRTSVRGRKYIEAYNSLLEMLSEGRRLEHPEFA
jgi:predicted transcriptional regulator